MPTQDMPDFSQPLSGLAQQQQVSVASSTSVNAVKDVANNGTVVDASSRSKLNIIGTNAISDDSANDRVTIKLCDRGTSFPGSPHDQDEYAYVADSTKGIVWRFKYNSGSASSYKWEFIGGHPLFSIVATEESTSSARYVALTTAGPSVVLPFAGDFFVQIGVYDAVTSGQKTWMSYDNGATGAVDADAIIDSGGATCSRVNLKTGLAAVTLTAKYGVAAGTGAWSNRTMSVWPVRTAG